MPTLEQRKAAFRTVFDIAIHNKRELNDNHKYCLMRWGQYIFHLSIIDMQECLSPAMSNGFRNFQLLGSLDREYQIEFRKLLYNVLNYNQTPTLQELQDFSFQCFMFLSDILSVIENRYNLPNSYSGFENSVYNTSPLKEW